MNHDHHTMLASQDPETQNRVANYSTAKRILDTIANRGLPKAEDFENSALASVAEGLAEALTFHNEG